ncbi:MAG: hypothetical protein CFE24_02240 [Flavobacterium sp. BFFFF2]|nr:MAG: hypothetical protein CFE24_02240 [Flavobacterium sp. BFFFF2]
MSFKVGMLKVVMLLSQVTLLFFFTKKSENFLDLYPEIQLWLWPQSRETLRSGVSCYNRTTPTQ